MKHEQSYIRSSIYRLSFPDKKTPLKRKRGSLSIESSLSPSLMSTPKTPGSVARPVPLSERQQLAMIMRMSDEASHGAPVTDQGNHALSVALESKLAMPQGSFAPINNEKKSSLMSWKQQLRRVILVIEPLILLTHMFMNIHARLHPLWIIVYIKINFHKEISCQVNLCRIRYIIFSMSKQSRPWSGSSYKSCLIWVCSVCKSFEKGIYEIKGYINLQHSIASCKHVCLFDLILYVPSTIFQLHRDGCSWVKPVLS